MLNGLICEKTKGEHIFVSMGYATRYLFNVFAPNLDVEKLSTMTSILPMRRL